MLAVDIYNMQHWMKHFQYGLNWTRWSSCSYVFKIRCHGNIFYSVKFCVGGNNEYRANFFINKLQNITSHKNLFQARLTCYTHYYKVSMPVMNNPFNFINKIISFY